MPKSRDETPGDPTRLVDTQGESMRVLLFSIVEHAPVPEDHFAELEGLCQTAEIIPVGTLAQVRRTPSPSHYFGKGKVDELAELTRELDASAVVCDEELSPVQGRNLEKALDVRVLDRSELILSIFAARARSTQARLQVELAQLQYQMPRLKRLWTHLDRERGGTGALGGMGEKQISIDRRLLAGRIQTLRRRLREIEARKRREVDARRKEFLVSLVGYTNAGKSTLMNAMTGASVLEENRLFSTLDTRTRRWDLGEGRHALLSDTVGFIRKIPHNLIASFHATLTEALEADLLLVVADVGDPHCEQRLETVLDVLDQVGARGKEMIPVFNKVDAVADRGLLPLLDHQFPGSVAVSARSGEGLSVLADRVRQRLDASSEEVWLRIPHERSAIQARLRAAVTVLEARYGPTSAFFRVLASPAALEQLEAREVEQVPADQVEADGSSG